MAPSLDDAIAAHQPYAPEKRLEEGEQLRVRLEVLDANPFQPRGQMDPAELETLKASIRTQGLIQPIAVRPKADGRYVIVAGHRRVEAFRQLLEASGTEEERRRYATIPGVVKLALDDARLASMALAENKDRANLNLIEEGRALERMLEVGLATSNEEVAALTGHPVRTVQRLRRLVRAPRFLATAIEAGLMVVVGTGPDGKERRELKRVELMAALQFMALHEYLVKTNQQKVADERTETLLRRALAGNWSIRRIEEYVSDAIRGKGARAQDGESADAGVVEPAATKPLFQATPRRFVVHLDRLQGASAEDVRGLWAAFGGAVGARPESE